MRIEETEEGEEDGTAISESGTVERRGVCSFSGTAGEVERDIVWARKWEERKRRNRGCIPSSSS